MAAALAIPAPDDTRARLIEAAGFVFSEQGYRAATVRDICTRANANVAAINYHFRDKLGLYVEVVRVSMGTHGDHDLGRMQLDAKPAAEALRLLIAGMLERALGRDRAAWYLRIMSHELAQPSEAFARVVDEVISPNYASLRGVLGRLLGREPGDDITRLCAHSVIGQVVHFAAARPVINILWPAMKMTPAQVAQIAKHIADFSLAGIRATGRNIVKENSGKRKI